MPQIFVRAYDAQLAAHNGKPPTAVDRTIGIVSDLTHMELQFSPRYWSLSYSATTQNGSNGARFKDNKYSHLKERWRSLCLNVTDEQEDTIFRAACLRAGIPYDIVGVMSLATKLDIIKPDPNKTWCNREVITVLQTALPIIGKSQVTPDETFINIENYLKQKEIANAA